MPNVHSPEWSPASDRSSASTSKTLNATLSAVFEMVPLCTVRQCAVLVVFLHSFHTDRNPISGNGFRKKQALQRKARSLTLSLGHFLWNFKECAHIADWVTSLKRCLLEWSCIIMVFHECTRPAVYCLYSKICRFQQGSPSFWTVSEITNSFCGPLLKFISYLFGPPQDFLTSLDAPSI